MVADIFRSHAILDSEGRHVNGTDKETNHQYGAAYDQVIEEYFGVWATGMSVEGREAVHLMMEVGVADGSSLLAWREIFPNAWCVGMDIHQSDKARGDRIEFHLGDQRVQSDCDRVAAGRLFDFVVEDATHRLEDTLLTLLYLWKYVRPGGVYVVEEFAQVGALRDNIKELFPFAEIVDTVGPFGGVEPLVVLRKPHGR